MPIDKIEAAATRQPPRCKHVLIPGETNCLNCGEQIHFSGFGRTR